MLTDLKCFELSEIFLMRKKERTWHLYLTDCKFVLFLLCFLSSPRLWERRNKKKIDYTVTISELISVYKVTKRPTNMYKRAIFMEDYGVECKLMIWQLRKLKCFAINNCTISKILYRSRKIITNLLSSEKFLLKFQ